MSGAPAPAPRPSTAARRTPLIKRLAVIAVTRRAAKMSRVRTGATTSWRRSRPTNSEAITVGNPIRSMSSESPVNAAASRGSTAKGRKWPAVAPTPNVPPPRNGMANSRMMTSATMRARFPLRRRLRSARSSAPTITLSALTPLGEGIMYRAAARSSPGTPALP